MLFLLAACTLPPEDLSRPQTAAAPEIGAATPPPARGPEGEKLYQQLYAGEVGEAAWAEGQRVRLLAWFDALALTTDQLESLDGLAVAAADADAAVSAAREAMGAKEQAAFVPIYAELSTRLATGEPLTEAEGAAFATRLETARTEVYKDGDPRAAHYARVRALLGLTRPWIAQLTTEQREKLPEGRFVLGRRLGPFVAPGDYATLVGTMWDGGDFGSLRATVRPTDEGHLDLGGLWSVESMQAGPDRKVEGLQSEAILLMILLEPQLRPAIAMRLQAVGGQPSAISHQPG